MDCYPPWLFAYCKQINREVLHTVKQSKPSEGGRDAVRRSLPSLNALRAFESAGRLGSVSAASDELAITPGAVSRQIKNLENDLGIALFGRNGRGVRLTEAGERLWIDLEGTFAQLADAVQRTSRRPQHSSIRVFSPTVFASAWLIRRLDRFGRREPEIDVGIYDEPSSVDVKASKPDLTIAWGRFTDSTNVIAERLTDDEIFPVCSPQIRPDDGLAGLVLLHRVGIPRTGSWPSWPTFLAAVGLDVGDSTRGLHLTGRLLLNGMREGKGVALTSSSAVHDDLVSGRLVRPVPESMKPDRGYWLLTPRTSLDRPEIMAFRNWLLDEVAACFCPPPPPPQDRPGHNPDGMRGPVPRSPDGGHGPPREPIVKRLAGRA